MAGGLVVAACGSGESTGATTPVDAAGTDGTTADATAAPEEAASTSSAEVAGPAPATEAHLFPDLNTVNIADGSTVNLASQLAGGDTPVLLWFFAPH